MIVDSLRFVFTTSALIRQRRTMWPPTTRNWSGKCSRGWRSWRGRHSNLTWRRTWLRGIQTKKADFMRRDGAICLSRMHSNVKTKGKKTAFPFIVPEDHGALHHVA